MVPAAIVIIFCLGVILALRTDGVKEFETAGRASHDHEALLKAWDMIVQSNITEDDIRSFVFRMREQESRRPEQPAPLRDSGKDVVPVLASHAEGEPWWN